MSEGLPIAPKNLPARIKALYEAARAFGAEHPTHSFTIDGKIVGDIGEVIAMEVFGLIPLRGNSKDHDMKTVEGKLVQVKATFRKPASHAVGLGLTKRSFEHLLVIEFGDDGRYEVLFNGPGAYIDQARAHKASPSLSRAQLRACQMKVEAHERLVPVGAPVGA